MSIQAASAATPVSRPQSFSPTAPAPTMETESSPATSTTDAFQPSEGLDSDSEGASPASLSALSGLVDSPVQMAANRLGPNEVNTDYPIKQLRNGLCVGTVGTGVEAKTSYLPCPQG